MRLASTIAMLGLAASLGAQEARPDNVPQTPPPPAPGASATLDRARAVRGAGVQIYVYTYGPGDEVFERFGHIALAVVDAATGEDIAFNWGMFDFDQPNFLTRFLTGDTKYWMAGYRTYEFNAAYQAQNRTIRRQRLDLTPTQRGAIVDFVAWNASEANKYYRYDYYNDNCSTRVRDLIDWAIGGRVTQALDTAGTPLTWRSETARITGENLPIYAGIEIALGQQADRHLTKWQSGFLPERLATDLATIVARDSLGTPVRLVAHDTLLFAAPTRAPLLTEPPDRQWSAFAIGLVIAALVAGLSLAGRANGAARATLTVLGTVWFAIGGVLGTALLLAATVTKHAPYMGSNLTLFQLQPLLLLAAALFWARGRDTRVGRAATWLAIVVATCTLVGVVAEHLPMFFHQHNFVVWMLVAPVNLALAWAALPARHAAPARRA
jgi:hypothetical protein